MTLSKHDTHYGPRVGFPYYDLTKPSHLYPIERSSLTSNKDKLFKARLLWIFDLIISETEFPIEMMYIYAVPEQWDFYSWHNFFFFFFNFVRPNLMICLCNVKIDQRNLSFNLEDAISELSILALFKLFYDDGVEFY